MNFRKKVSIKLLIASVVISLIIGFIPSGYIVNKYYGRHFLDRGLFDMMQNADSDLLILQRLNENKIDEARAGLEMFIKQNLSISIEYDHSFFNYKRRDEIEELIQRAKIQFNDSLNVPTYTDTIVDLNELWKDLNK